jgi:hypothetical protein
MSTMLRVDMRVFVTSAILVLALLPRAAVAQDPPPPIPWFVVDLHASVPRFPSDDPALALSRNMNIAELPGSGLGGQVGLHLYPLRTRIVTFGIGGEIAHGRARQTPSPEEAAAAAANGGTPLRSAEEHITTYSPQVSLNFGNGSGWSYLSVGLGQSIWSIDPEGLGDYLPNEDRLKTVNYGGGGRWFIRPHVAFSFDVRFYAINPGFAFIFPGTPRTRLLIIAAGVSLK